MKQFLMTLVLVVFAGPLLADAAISKAVNDVRAGKGRKALVYSQRLEQVAQAHANDMAKRGFFSHTGSNGSNVGKRVSRAGYKWCFVAENIGKGQTSFSQVMNTWVNSSGHYKNIVARKAREFAVARAPGNLWVMVLARPC